jgi:peroxiredoxin
LQLRVAEFQQRLPELESRGIQIVAISVDPPDINRRQRQKLGYTYTVPVRSKAEVIRRYDLLHRGAGSKGQILRDRQSF